MSDNENFSDEEIAAYRAGRISMLLEVMERVNPEAAEDLKKRVVTPAPADTNTKVKPPNDGVPVGWDWKIKDKDLKPNG